jgi:hypothetical protein
MHRQPAMVVNIGHLITIHHKKQWLIHRNFDGAQHNLVHSLGHGPTNKITLVFLRAILHLQKLKKLFKVYHRTTMFEQVP